MSDGRGRPGGQSRGRRGLWLLGLWLGVTSLLPAVEIREFDDPALTARFKDLTYELRCLVCQNQNIADSDAELAQDLRREVDRMLREGKSDRDITDFMVARYGEFVLYRPRLRPGTLVLWIGPFVIAVAGLGLLYHHIRRSRTLAPSSPTLSAAERARVNALLDADDDPR